MSDSLTHRSQILNSQMDTLAEGYEEQDPSQENITHQAKIFRQQMAQLAPDASSIEPETENITHAAKLFNQAMQYFIDNPPSPSGGSIVSAKINFSPVANINVTITAELQEVV